MALIAFLFWIVSAVLADSVFYAALLFAIGASVMAFCAAIEDRRKQ